MRKPGLLSACLLLTLLAAGQTTAATEPLPLPEIFLVGSAHNLPFDARYHYSLIDLEAEVRALHPDVICGEITPKAFNGVMEGNFPPEAAMLAELAPSWGMRFVPADWRVSFALQARGEREEVRDKRRFAEGAAAEAQEKAYYEAFSGGSFYDYTNGSPRYQAMVDHKFEDVIGTGTLADLAAGAWHERNRRIVQNCLAHAGGAKRIMFIFGNAHLPQLKRQLTARGLHGDVLPRLFTPAGLGTMPQAVLDRWRRNLRNLQGVVDGTLPVSADVRAKAKNTNRIPQLRSEIAVYTRP